MPQPELDAAGLGDRDPDRRGAQGPPDPDAALFGGGPGADDGDVLYVTDEPGLARKAGAVVLFVLLFLFGVLGLGAYWVNSQVNPAGSGEQIAVNIPADSGMATIARVLEEKGVVANATLFRYYARWKGLENVKAGEYDKLGAPDSMDHVIERLREGPLPLRYTTLTIPEGLWAADAAQRMREKFGIMNDAELLAALQGARSRYQPPNTPIDGFLFPATYQVEQRREGDERALVDQMVRKFDAVADQIKLGDATAKLGNVAGAKQLTPYDVLKIAALIEAEAKVPEDRARIARVIYNRLNKDMRLDIDATVFVAIQQHKEELSKSDLEADSPYNLRKYPGLTPTPINSPGQASLEAALNPSTEPNVVNALYYVLTDKAGHHGFYDNQQDFDRAAAKARAEGVFK